MTQATDVAVFGRGCRVVLAVLAVLAVVQWAILSVVIFGTFFSTLSIHALAVRLNCAGTPDEMACREF